MNRPTQIGGTTIVNGGARCRKYYNGQTPLPAAPLERNCWHDPKTTTFKVGGVHYFELGGRLTHFIPNRKHKDLTCASQQHELGCSSGLANSSDNCSFYELPQLLNTTGQKYQITQEVKNERFIIWTRHKKCAHFRQMLPSTKATNGQTDIKHEMW